MKPFVFTAALAALLCGCSTPPAVTSEVAPAPQCLPDGSCCGNRIVARVGDATLTEKELDTIVAAAMEHLLKVEESDELSDEERAELRASCRTNVLQAFALRAMILAIAERHGITVTPEELNKVRAEYEAYYETSEEPEETNAVFSWLYRRPDFEVALLSEKIAEYCIHNAAKISDEEVQAELATRTVDIAALKAEFDYYRSAVASGCVEFETLVVAHSEVTTPLTLSEYEIEAVLPPEMVDEFLTTPEGALTDVLVEDGSIALVKILKRTPAQEDTGVMIEALILAKPIPFGGTFHEVRDELESLRLETTYFAFMSEQIKAIGISFPVDPELETTFVEGFTFR